MISETIYLIYKDFLYVYQKQIILHELIYTCTIIIEFDDKMLSIT